MIDPKAEAPATAAASLSQVYLLTVTAAVICVEVLPVPALVRDAVFAVVGLAVVIAIQVAIVRYRPRAAAAWHVMAAGQLLWVIADSLHSWQRGAADTPVFPSIADIFALLAYPVIAVGLGMLTIGRAKAARDLGPFLDGAAITAGLGLLSWVLLAGPTSENAANSPYSAFVATAYPVMDILLVGALIRLISSPGGRSPAFGYLLGALTLLITADTLSVVLDLHGVDPVYALGSFRMFAYALWGAAVLHPSMAKLSDPAIQPDTRFRGTRLLAVVLATMIAPVVLAVQQFAGVPLDVWPVVLGSMVVLLLVIVRMSLAVEQIASIHQSLEVLQDELAVQARHDPLTGLPNRTQVMRMIAGALGRNRRRQGTVGLLFIDLDGFKVVNDSHGHRAGDEVLREVAHRMESELREGDFVGRLGGDEFLVGIEDVADETATVDLANRLIAAVSQEIHLDTGVTVTVGASIGIALGRGGATDVESLVHEADLATYQAKAAGRGRVELFGGRYRSAPRDRDDIESALAYAITHDELVLHYQPIVDLETGQVDCYEALVRWDRPGRGLVPPDEFLPAAESSDLICELDAWVLRAAIGQLGRWNLERADCALQVAVNISGRHVGQDRILNDVVSALRGETVIPAQLVLEVTETAPVDATAAVDNLVALRALGVVISLDDFGTGYQSIAQLSRLPIDILKIDREFVDTSTATARSVLDLMVRTAHVFGARVIAEGVEKAEQLELVRSLGCEYAQGFYLGRPAPAETFPAGVHNAGVHNAGVHNAAGPPSSNAANPASSKTGTPSCSAFSALDPGLSPTTT